MKHTKEEFEELKKNPPLCKCGCGQHIVIKDWHRKHGVSNYICGHYNKGRAPPNKGKTFEEYYGEKKAREIKEKVKKTQFKKGQIAWNKGKHIPQEQKEKQIKNFKQWYKDNPEKVKKMIDTRTQGIQKHYNNLKESGKYDEEMKKRGENISKSKKGNPLTENHKEALKKAHWSHRDDADEIRQGIISKQLGKEPWNKGLTKETDERLANSITSQPHSEEWNEKVRIALENSEAMKAYRNSPECIENCRKGGLAAAAVITPEIIQKRAMASRLAQNIRPNGPETLFINICQKYNLPYKYVGDGTFWIESKNPDFINTNGEKIIIEINGIYWHLIKFQYREPNLTREQVEIREKKHFENLGYKCIIIWDDELSDENLVLSKFN